MTAQFKDIFADQGYLHLKHYFDMHCLELFEKRIVDLYCMQARKIGEYRSLADDVLEGRANIRALFHAMEEKDKTALYEVQKFLPNCRRIRELFDTKFIEICASLFGGNPDTTLIEGPALFENMPRSQRLLYKWHSEAHYYSKRRRFINCWLPVFGKRTVENGAMTIMPKSHKKTWDSASFAEYVGYNKDTENNKNTFKQYEIPANFLENYEAYDCVSERGDLILFDRNLVHTSNANTSSEISFAVVVRVWDPTDDLTLSGNMEATAYGGNIGRADLMVAP
jgi:hypothetical protein